jgi:hypothetical protein|tara:strand:+ start:219 stop:536 length:318 start_codon:yes stop_codon:yes gene_type:complete
VSDEILIIANQMANQGKKPSIALIKTKLSTSVPLPLIISTLKTWQHDPEFIAFKYEKPMAIKKKEIDENANTLNIAIEKALIPFKQEINTLKLEVAEIKKQLIKA